MGERVGAIFDRIAQGERLTAFRRGRDVGAWQALFGGPQLEPGAEVVHRVFGRRLRVTLEWLDEPPPAHLLARMRAHHDRVEREHVDG